MISLQEMEQQAPKAHLQRRTWATRPISRSSGASEARHVNADNSDQNSEVWHLSFLSSMFPLIWFAYSMHASLYMMTRHTLQWCFWSQPILAAVIKAMRYGTPFAPFFFVCFSVIVLLQHCLWQRQQHWLRKWDTVHSFLASSSIPVSSSSFSAALSSPILLFPLFLFPCFSFFSVSSPSMHAGLAPEPW